MKPKMPLIVDERTNPNLSSLPPVGPRGLCLEIRIGGVVSRRQRGPESEVLARLKKRARLYQGLAEIKPFRT